MCQRFFHLKRKSVSFGLYLVGMVGVVSSVETAQAGYLLTGASFAIPPHVPASPTSVDGDCRATAVNLGNVSISVTNNNLTLPQNLVTALYDNIGQLIAYGAPQSIPANYVDDPIPGIQSLSISAAEPAARPFKMLMVDMGAGSVPPASYEQAVGLSTHQYQFDPLTYFPANAACAALPVGDTTQTSRETAGYRSATGMMTQISGMIKGRINRGFSRGSAVNNRGSQRGLIDLSGGRSGQNAGEDGQRWGGWANVSWSGIEDTSSVAGQKGGLFTGIIGADYAVRDGLVTGLALSLGGSHFNSQINQFESQDRAFGMTPYLAWQINDHFSLDGMVNYTLGQGKTIRNHRVRGNFGIQRYFLAANGSYFNNWGDFSLLGTLGISYGQSFESGYREDDGTEIGSRQSQLGSLNIDLKPSYLFLLDAEMDLFLEPYLMGNYRYDFALTEISGHSNDRDAFRLGAGMTLFSGNSISGSVEASTMLGRDQQQDINVTGTLTFAF